MDTVDMNKNILKSVKVLFDRDKNIEIVKQGKN